MNDGPFARELRAVMFPVEKRKLFADTGSGQHQRASAHMALVNGDTGKVVSVVGKSYQVLHNSVALQLARRGCTAAFPNTGTHAWQVIGVWAPSSGGHCTIDLAYRRPGKLLVYDWEIGPGVRERYEPFLRVRNGYNGRTAFSLYFGVIRVICTNGWIEVRAVPVTRVSHDTRNIEEVVERKVIQADFKGVALRFQRAMSRLWSIGIHRRHFQPIILTVLQIRRPKQIAKDLKPHWKALDQAIEEKIDGYVSELGSTAYALWNTISDLSTSPPVGYPCIRRTSHSLQRLASLWLSDFSLRARDPDFDLDAYVKDLCRTSADGQNGQPARIAAGREPHGLPGIDTSHI